MPARKAALTESSIRKMKKADLVELASQEMAQSSFLEERLVDLELALEDRDWINLFADNEDGELTQQGILRIVQLARAAYLSNPLINHAVSVQVNYVFAQGINIRGKGRNINAAVQATLDDERNKVELFSHQARCEKEVQLQIEANIFFVFFTNGSTGNTRIGTIPAADILKGDIICNPDDRREPWYYKRVWSQRTFNEQTGETTQKQREEYYPDFRYNPKTKPDQIGGKKVHWDAPVFHVKVGGLPGYKFGVPEVYSALDWAKAVRRDLEDYATLRRSLARFAWRVYTKGGKAGVAAAKSKLQSSLGLSSELTGTSGETNPAPTAGSAFLANEGRTLEPIKTGGATTSPEDARRLWLMVSAATGIPETILAGNADVGNMATAKTLDRPTELQMRSRQTLWHDIHETILSYCVRRKAEASKVPGASVADGMVMVAGGTAREGEEKRKAEVLITFPSILERDVKNQVDAVVGAATLAGKENAGIFELEMLTRMLLEALNVDDIDAAMNELFPEGVDAETGERVEPSQRVVPEGEAPAVEGRRFTERDLFQALQQFGNEIRQLRESHLNGNGKEPADVEA